MIVDNVIRLLSTDFGTVSDSLAEITAVEVVVLRRDAVP